MFSCRTLAAILLLTFVIAMPVMGENYIRIEAEGYYESSPEEGCGPPIQVHQCDAASGGLGVDGVNCAGEWIALELVPPPFAFQIGTRSAASEGFARTFQIRVLNVDDNYVEAAIDTLVTQPGLGFD